MDYLLYLVALAHYGLAMAWWAVQCAGIYAIAYTRAYGHQAAVMGANWWLLSKIHQGAMRLRRGM
jgi:hypothetical protein